MSTTTVADLLEAARLEASRYRDARTPTSRETWECFDTTTYRLLHTIAGPVRWDGRTGTHSLAMLSQVLDSYPRPLLPAMPDADLSARETANLLGVSVSTVHSRIRAGEIPARQDRGGYAVSITAIPTRTDIRPADPLDPHPLARLSCRLGALGDLLAQARSERAGTVYSEGLHREEHQVALTSTVLAVASSAARTAVTASHLDDVDRPLAVARYATAAIDTLGPTTATPGPIARLASVSPVTRPRTLNDRLEAGVAAWLTAARAELDRTIPSTASLANIANQTVHLCAAAEALALRPEGAGIARFSGVATPVPARCRARRHERRPPLEDGHDSRSPLPSGTSTPPATSPRCSPPWSARRQHPTWPSRTQPSPTSDAASRGPMSCST